MAQRQAAAVAAAAAPAPAPAAGAAPVGVGAMIRPAVMPESYDGTGDWGEYQQYFEQCGLVNGWQDPVKAQFLSVRLRGPAQRFFATIPAARQANWQHLCADMAQRFLPPGTALQCKAQFKSRRRTGQESLATLADELRKLVVRAYPHMPDQDREELVRDQFIEALSPVSLRVRLQENPPATVQAAVEMALHLERVWGCVDMPSNAAQRMVGPYGEPLQQQLVATVTPSSTSRTVETADLVKLLSRMEARLSDLEERRNFRPRSGPAVQERGALPTCWGCGKVGHMQRECRSSRHNGAGRGRSRVQPSHTSPRPSGNGK